MGIGPKGICSILGNVGSEDQSKPGPLRRISTGTRRVIAFARSMFGGDPMSFKT